MIKKYKISDFAFANVLKIMLSLSNSSPKYLRTPRNNNINIIEQISEYTSNLFPTFKKISLTDGSLKSSYFKD